MQAGDAGADDADVLLVHGFLPIGRASVRRDFCTLC
jgi:hypothetical protein